MPVSQYTVQNTSSLDSIIEEIIDYLSKNISFLKKTDFDTIQNIYTNTKIQFRGFGNASYKDPFAILSNGSSRGLGNNNASSYQWFNSQKWTVEIVTNITGETSLVSLVAPTTGYTYPLYLFSQNNGIYSELVYVGTMRTTQNVNIDFANMATIDYKNGVFVSTPFITQNNYNNLVLLPIPDVVGGCVIKDLFYVSAYNMTVPEGIYLYVENLGTVYCRGSTGGTSLGTNISSGATILGLVV